MATHRPQMVVNPARLVTVPTRQPASPAPPQLPAGTTARQRPAPSHHAHEPPQTGQGTGRTHSGTWEKVSPPLLAQADAEGDLDWVVAVDSTIEWPREDGRHLLRQPVQVTVHHFPVF
ncbi:hypothetical protein SUDANB120_00008 [Streptomyces sp. enrichment culture]|uniref:hypothetical protein n=1 Tax=Streptomyces sp. enrichment culture TaxID=1795815 RepID=UPI003F566498